MPSINALSLTAHVNEWVLTSDHPRILHVFDNACNLVNERQEVLSIVTPQIGDGPFNLVLEKNITFSQFLNADARVSIHENQLLVGHLAIQIRNAKVWDPNIDWKLLHAGRDHILRQLSQLMTIDYEPSLPPSLLSNLCKSIVIHDIPSSLNAARQLAGLGNGLTPSGDDFVLGALYALRIIHPPERADALAAEIADTAAPLTTTLSAAWFRSAGRGEAGSLWHDFLEALISDVPAQIQNAVNQILAVGATSGADAWSGFSRSLTFFLEDIEA